MSNKKLREGPATPFIAEPMALPEFKCLGDAIFYMMFASDSFNGRWDTLTHQEDLIAENKENVLNCAHNFLIARGSFQAVAAGLFGGIARTALDQGDSRSAAEMRFYQQWRDAYRTWRATLELLMHATMQPISVRTLWDATWPPPPPLVVDGEAKSQRPVDAINCQNDLLARLGYLGANLRILDALVRKEAPSLLLELPR